MPVQACTPPCDGELDEAWATQGIAVVTDVNEGRGNALAVKGDMTVVVTTCRDGDEAMSACAYRLDRNGMPDADFGVGGRAMLTQLPGPLNGIPTWVLDMPHVASLAPDGHIAIIVLQHGHTWLVRLRDDGKAIDGAIRDPLPGSSPLAVLVQRDGKVVLAGRGYPGFPYYSSVGRFEADLSGFDADFGLDGISMLDPADGAGDVTLRALVETGNNALVLVGESRYPDDVNGYVARLRPDGFYDAGFSKDGRYEDINLAGYADLVADDNDGVFVLANYIKYKNPGNIIVTHLRTSGTWVSSGFYTFVDGACSTIVDNGAAIAVQPDGKVVVAGYCRNTPDAHPGDNDVSDTDTLLLRLLPDMSIDPAFGSQGFVRFRPGENSMPYGVLVADGGILVDWVPTADTRHRRLARFMLDEIFPSGFEAAEE